MPGPRPLPVAIDTDPGIDDALALMLALGSPELSVELITTVAGNVPVGQATDNARRLLTLIAPAKVPPLAMGAAAPIERRLRTARNVHGSDGLGGMTALRSPAGAPRFPIAMPRALPDAAGRLVALARRRGRALTVIALGPLTNIAVAIRRDPGAMKRIRRLVVMGGAVRDPGNVTPGAEFNIFVDPEAAQEVIESGIPITLVPLDATRQVRLNRDYLRRHLGTSRRPLASALRALTRERHAGAAGRAGFPMHDPLTVAAAIEPGLLRTEPLPLRIELHGAATLGMTVADRRGSARAEGAWRLVDVAAGVDAEAALDLFAERVLRPAAAARAGARPRAAQVVVVGSANTDFIVSTPHLPGAGETVPGSPLLTAYGGKGANQAVAAARAGARVRFVAKLGDDDAGRHYLAHLRRSGLEVSGGIETALPSGVALITVDRRGQNQISVAPGANERLMPADLPSPAALRGASVLVAQLETPIGTVEEALRRGREAGALTVLNAAPARPLPRRFARLVDVLVANEGEARLLAGARSGRLHEAVLALAGHGYPRIVVTLGRRGIVYRAAGTTRRLPALKVKALDATGAGDTFTGYLASALARGLALPDALAEANAAAALSVTRKGAQPAIPERREVIRFRQDQA